MFNRLTPFIGKRSARERLEGILRDAVLQNSPEFTPTEYSFLRNILALRALHVEDVMVPRADIIGLELSSSVRDAMRDVAAHGHSRLPVYRENLDDPAGFIHVKDLIKALAKAADNEPASQSIADVMDVQLGHINFIHEALYVPPSMQVLDLFLIMQTTRVHLALIIDEYGGTFGLATIEDIVEAVVGEIEDEHDEMEVRHIITLPTGNFLVNARIELDELRATIGDEALKGLFEEDDDIDTLGGLLVSLAGHVPVRGEVLALGNLFEVKIVDADPRRVKMVSLYKVKDGPTFELGTDSSKVDNETDTAEKTVDAIIDRVAETTAVVTDEKPPAP